MKRIGFAIFLLLAGLSLGSTGSQAANDHRVFGNWDVTAYDDGKAAPGYDAMQIGRGGFQGAFTYNAKEVDWIYKTKFIEVGQQVPNSYYIRWTRFEFANAQINDRFLGQSGAIVFTAHGVGQCTDRFDLTYEGIYTQLDGNPQTIRFRETFWFQTGLCDLIIDWYGFEGYAYSVDATDDFLWRIVTVQNPWLGVGGCVTTAYDNFNNNAYGTWVTVNENLMGPTPGGGVRNVKIEQNSGWAVTRNFLTLPYHAHANPNRVHHNDIVASLNINADPGWLFDRRPAEILHDSTQIGESWAALTDADCVNLVVLIEYQTQVFYNEPDWYYWPITVHDLENM